MQKLGHSPGTGTRFSSLAKLIFQFYGREELELGHSNQQTGLISLAQFTDFLRTDQKCWNAAIESVSGRGICQRNSDGITVQTVGNERFRLRKDFKKSFRLD